MEPQGSFGNVSPDNMEAIREALARRGMGDSVPAMGQQSAASPTAAPLPPQAPQGASQAMNMPQVQPSMPTENTEAKLIVSALKDRLKALSTIDLGGNA